MLYSSTVMCSCIHVLYSSTVNMILRRGADTSESEVQIHFVVAFCTFMMPSLHEIDDDILTANGILVRQGQVGTVWWRPAGRM